MTNELPERILNSISVNENTGCWEWTGTLDQCGYGRDVRWGGHRERAHRILYRIFVGDIPEGAQLDHLCRVRHCVNPEHLEAVSQQENIRRGMTGKLNHHNAHKTHCSRGHGFTDSNTYIRPNGGRMCKRCAADRGVRKYHASKS